MKEIFQIFIEELQQIFQTVRPLKSDLVRKILADPEKNREFMKIIEDLKENGNSPLEINMDGVTYKIRLEGQYSRQKAESNSNTAS